ncbi:CocE/NonD family hydrolase [Pseudoalteromonas rubra]|uniref:CocE/NonD family hydrolase n=1 Tax=Pseudoalteromonas rubra TaxID=43658 RepID=UPI000F79FCEA|nr:CocE/NonD family hydrolase [Pseudoalteromonas rubra]
MKTINSYLAMLLCTVVSGHVMAKELVKPITIPMSDGTLLSGTVFLPNIDNAIPIKASPVVVQITPYGREEAKKRGQFFSNHGYVFVSVDSRGRGTSQGHFTPFVDDGKDGYDIVEWLAKQPFSNGQVATLGGSYRGFTQWAMQKFSPPSLKSMIAIAPVYPGKDFPLRNNIFANYTMSWLNMVSKAGKGVAYGGEQWNTLYLKQKNEGLAFADLEKLVGNQSTVYKTWLQHPSYDDYWREFVPAAADYKAIKFPILSVTGHYDGDQYGTLSYYKHHQKWGDSAVFDQHYLLIGPWDHSGTRYPKATLGDLALGEPSILDMDQVYLDWFDWTLKGKPKPIYLQGRISHYMQKSGHWYTSEQLAQGNWHTLYFTFNELSDNPNVFVKEAHRRSQYVYDPMTKESVPLEFDLSAEMPLRPNNGDQLTFDSAALKADLVLSGQIQAELWLSIDVPDTDFHARVFEVCPQRKPLLLAFAIKRARYSSGLQNQSVAISEQPFRLAMNDFNYVSRVLSKGCKIRFVVSSSSWYHQKHYNGPGAVAYQTVKDARAAKVTLWHDNTHASQLRLPVLKTLPVFNTQAFPFAGTAK